MANRAITALTVATGLLFFCIHANAAGKVITISTERDSVAIQQATAPNALNAEDSQRESLFPESSRSLSLSHFSWGAEAGASLDMTSHDLSTFDIDVTLGYKNSIFNLAGIGAGVHRSIHTGNNFIPIYAVLRTDFRKKESPLFLDLRAGYSFNTVDDAGTLGDFYSSLGMGINLKQTRKAKSYVILALAYQYFSDKNIDKLSFDTHYIFFSRLTIGVNF